MQDTIDRYRLLLLEVARLYEKHEAGRREPFNVFTVLRTAHDEVNLHSRFLHALLDYRESAEASRENLKDFLDSVYKDDDVPVVCSKSARVDRESAEVDILIRDPSSMQAVVIENKIWAADQPEQLQRYDEQQKRDGYDSHLLYLTLDGHEPEEHSHGSLDVKCISYRDDIRPWLECCQKRAYDEPALRESIVQYRHLVAKLTGTDLSEAYMKELVDLCEEAENIGLVYDLNKALVDARITLLQKLWNKITSGLSNIPDLPNKNNPEDTFKGFIGEFVTRQRKYQWQGTSYRFKNRKSASLGITVGNCIRYGVTCSQESHEVEYNEFKEKLGPGKSDWWWPWFKEFPRPNLKFPDRSDLELMAHDGARSKFSNEISAGVSELWARIKEKDLDR